MHIYTLREIAVIVIKLMNEGMAQKHAVHITAAAYGIDIDQLYAEVAAITE